MAIVPVRPWAVATSVVVHAGVLAASLLWSEPEASGAQAVGTGGIAVSLGPSGSPPSAAVAETAEVISTAETEAPEVVEAVEAEQPREAVAPEIGRAHG